MEHSFGRECEGGGTAGIVPPPHVERAPATPQGLGSTVELLKVLLRFEAERQDVAPRLIASVADLEAIAASDNADVPALRGWRRDVFGERALALKRGEIALALDRVGPGPAGRS